MSQLDFPALTPGTTEEVATPEDNVLEFRRRSENSKITFLHRFLYHEDNPNVLMETANKAIHKLKIMGIIPKNFTLPTETEGLNSARKNYEQGNYKFYKASNSEQNG
jgi:hypothetical protein